MTRTLEQQIRDLERRRDCLEQRMPNIGWGEEFDAARTEMFLISDQLLELRYKLEKGGDE